MAADHWIVALGASAGGIEALEAFFKAMPRDNGMAFAVITHLDPNRESMLAQILERATQMSVANARDDEPVEAGHIHVLPPGAIMTIRDGRLRLRPTSATERERTPIDLFFSSLAEDQNEHAIGIILSGSGSDGTLGLRAIKENGGLTIAQGSNLSQPRFSDMPMSAVAAGFVDLVLPVEDMPQRLLDYVRNFGAFDPKRPSDALSKIYALLRSRTGHDFSQYKDETFRRRIQRRMQVVQTTRLDDYVQQAQKEPEEVGALFRDLLIGVTNFFRDPAAFQALETLVIPKLFEGKRADDEVRVWVPGCATGEEVYSIAMLLRERMDVLASVPRVQIFATDIDENALAVARSARYPANMVRGITAERLTRFFVTEGGTYRLSKTLRDMCVFSSHSVIRDPPFSRLDLISCRNLLIYLKPELQGMVIPLFHFALQQSGYLFLGLSESISRYTDLFRPIDRKNRIFDRRALGTRPAIPFRQLLPANQPGPATSTDRSSSRTDVFRKAAETIQQHFTPAYAIVDEDSQALYFSVGTGKYLQAPGGPPTRDLVAMARVGLRADLRAALHRTIRTGQRATRDRIAVRVDGGIQMIGLTVEPITEGDETVYGVVFIDLGPISAPAENADAAAAAGEDAAVQHLERELRETREHLQSTIEELETANEEFRSSNEELLSVNEELQSTNEELETSKEELQSLNEELQTVNSELTHKIDELDSANSDLNNLLESTQIATVFLDRDLAIRSFTPAVTKIFNLIRSDRGRPLTDIVGRVDYQGLEADIRAVFARGEAIERSLRAGGGEDFYLASLLPYRGHDNAIDGVVATFVDVTKIVAAEEQQKALAAELSHRVKNSLAVVASIAERTLEPGEAKDRFISRLHSQAQTHELLSGAFWAEVELRKLILVQLAPHPIGDEANVRIGGPPVLLKPRAALLLSMAIHELTTNAAKYGALSVPDGCIEATWAVTGDTSPHLELTWVERGGPKVDCLPRRGFGTELIERGIPFELQGEAKLEVVDGALQCRIRVPATPDLLTFGSVPSDPERD